MHENIVWPKQKTNKQHSQVIHHTQKEWKEDKESTNRKTIPPQKLHPLQKHTTKNEVLKEARKKWCFQTMRKESEPQSEIMNEATEASRRPI